MNLILIGLVGLLVGALRARRRGGTAGDLATWAIGHALGFMLLTVVVLATYDFIVFYVL